MTGSPDAETSSVSGEIVAGLLGAGVAAACLLPPIAHFVTGPLGPFIGAFVAASRVAGHFRARAVVALTLATVLSGVVGALVSTASALASAGELPAWFPSGGPQIAGLVAVVWVYGGTLAALGTVVRGAVGRSGAG